VVSVFAVVYGLAQLLYGAAGDRLGKLRVLTFTTVASGATLEFGGVAVGAEAITLNGATLSASADSSLAGAVNLGANSSIS
jgi:hypothetical protein